MLAAIDSSVGLQGHPELLAEQDYAAYLTDENHVGWRNI
jgi:hypothetical protein